MVWIQPSHLAEGLDKANVKQQHDKTHREKYFQGKDEFCNTIFMYFKPLLDVFIVLLNTYICSVEDLSEPPFISTHWG